MLDNLSRRAAHWLLLLLLVAVLCWIGDGARKFTTYHNWLWDGAKATDEAYDALNSAGVEGTVTDIAADPSRMHVTGHVRGPGGWKGFAVDFIIGPGGKRYPVSVTLQHELLMKNGQVLPCASEPQSPQAADSPSPSAAP